MAKVTRYATQPVRRRCWLQRGAAAGRGHVRPTQLQASGGKRPGAAFAALLKACWERRATAEELSQRPFSSYGHICRYTQIELFLYMLFTHSLCPCVFVCVYLLLMPTLFAWYQIAAHKLSLKLTLPRRHDFPSVIFTLNFTYISCVLWDPRAESLGRRRATN